MPKMAKVLSGLVAALLILAMIVSVAPVAVERLQLDRGRVPAITPLVVLGGSMEPSIRIGSIAVVAKVDASQVRVGDTITFKTPGAASAADLTTHRVTSIETRPGGRLFVTQGDANHVADVAKVDGDMLIGRVLFAVPYAGYLSTFVRTGTGFLLLVVIPAILVIAGEVRSIVRTVREAARASGRVGVTDRAARAMEQEEP